MRKEVIMRWIFFVLFVLFSSQTHAQTHAQDEVYLLGRTTVEVGVTFFQHEVKGKEGDLNISPFFFLGSDSLIGGVQNIGVGISLEGKILHGHFVVGGNAEEQAFFIGGGLEAKHKGFEFRVHGEGSLPHHAHGLLGVGYHARDWLTLGFEGDCAREEDLSHCGLGPFVGFKHGHSRVSASVLFGSGGFDAGDRFGLVMPMLRLELWPPNLFDDNDDHHHHDH